ncbi:MAG TPA: hypothetical protein VK361_02495 [Rubrobacteraceae bacterium]|nr:hypothetical protein [Rubrobacteraceae bacterium]
MDQQQTQNINQAAEQLTDSTQQAFRALAGRTVALLESNLSLTKNFYQNWIDQVNNQAQSTREAVQNLRDQGQRQREAAETLSQEATNTYSEFLNSALSFYQNALSTATQVGQQNIQRGAQATQQSVQTGVQAASQSAQQAIEAANQVGQQGAPPTSQSPHQSVEATNQPVQQGARGAEQSAQEDALAAQRVSTGVPIEDYDDLNVGKIVEQLDNLSADELQRVRAYEQQHKNRDTLLKQIDRRMMEATGVPIWDYDDLNVGEIVEQLDNLSADELLAARAYEQQNKDRDSLIGQIDRRIKAAS